MWTAATPPVHGQSPTARVDEYRVKAAVLFYLARFVSWPQSAFADATAPMAICVLGDDPFGARLDEIVRGNQIGVRSVVTARVSEVRAGCHVLFISSSEQRRLPALIASLRGSGALTVGEAGDFTALGGMVGLSTKGDQVRLDINVAAADAEHLKISARLLALSSGRRRAAEGGP
jgi:hypothetical protein